tara:strand:+ start:723 stop:1061 length:339 start_codon:yes stop_codon:yes gene_type:complete
MNQLIKDFLELAENDEIGLRIDSLLSEEEQFQWEVLVKAMDSIDIMQIGKDLEKISKTYQLERWQELSIIAYVKLLEMMMKRAKDAGALTEALSGLSQSKPTETEYSGSMFG